MNKQQATKIKKNEETKQQQKTATQPQNKRERERANGSGKKYAAFKTHFMLPENGRE